MNRVKRYGFFSLCVVFSLVGMAGCVKRTKIVTKPREDQSLHGNRGYLAGTPPATERKTDAMRTYYETEVEVPTLEVNIKLPPWRREWVDKDLSGGNRGYLIGGPYQRQMAKPTSALPASARRSSFFHSGEPPQTEGTYEEKKPTYDTYTIQKGDNLGGISMKVYGTSKRWKRIFEANQDVLKNPNRLKVGQVLRIPKGQEAPKASRSDTLK